MLNNGDLLDAIATLTSKRESGRLQIKASGSAGAFFFKDGKLVDARMGPFSGFPAVNYAVSLGQATLNFDSSIQPPAQTSTVFAVNERMLLKDRFGIKVIDLDLVDEDQTTQMSDSKLPISIAGNTVVAEAGPTPIPEPPQESAYRLPIHDSVRSRVRTRESRRRTARNRSASLKQKERQVLADQLRNQALEQFPKNIHEHKTVESENAILKQMKRVVTSDSAMPVHSYMVEPAEAARPGDVIDPALTVAPATNQTAGNKKINSILFDAEFSVAVKPKTPTTLLFWILVVVLFFVSVVLGYYVSSNLSRNKVAASTSINANVNTPPNTDQDQPIADGPLHGKDAVLQKPEYPTRARSEGASGKVTVAILVNKQGRVVSARALTGQPLLKVAAEVAAKQSKFSPEKLQQSKTSGTITYSFKL